MPCLVERSFLIFLSSDILMALGAIEYESTGATRE